MPVVLYGILCDYKEHFDKKGVKQMKSLDFELYEVLEMLEDLHENNHKTSLTAWEVDEKLKKSIYFCYKVAGYLGRTTKIDRHLSEAERLN